MSTLSTLDPREALRSLLDQNSRTALHSYLDTLSPGDIARAVTGLEPEEQEQLMLRLAPDDAAELATSLPGAQGTEIVGRLAPEDAALIVTEMPSDHRADLIADIGESNAEAILARLPEAEATEARTLAAYPPDVAGGLMVTEFISYPASATVASVTDDMRRGAVRYANYDVQYTYVNDERGRLVGVLRMRDLLLAPGQQGIASLMIEQPLAVSDTADLDELRDLFELHSFLGVPVLDTANQMLGIVQRSAVDAAYGQREELDHLRSRGIVGGEELRCMPLMLRSRRRLAWLSVNIVLNIIAASVIALHQDTLQAAIALAVFLPIISDMSGCSGNQAVAVSMRELSLGLVQPRDLLSVLGKEVWIGLINGLALGSLIAAAAWIWQQNAYLGLVVGAALALNTTLAVSLGGTIPLILRRFGVDPALASGPVLTTITDMCGFFLTLSFAGMCLAELSP